MSFPFPPTFFSLRSPRRFMIGSAAWDEISRHHVDCPEMTLVFKLSRGMNWNEPISAFRSSVLRCAAKIPGCHFLLQELASMIICDLFLIEALGNGNWILLCQGGDVYLQNVTQELQVVHSFWLLLTYRVTAQDWASNGLPIIWISILW